MEPVTMALIGGGILASQVAKGVAKMGVAKKRRDMARGLQTQGKLLEDKAWGNRTNFNPTNVRDMISQQQSMLMGNISGGSSAEAAMRNQADLGVSSAASQLKRASSTTGQAMSGILAAEKMRQSGYANAAIQGQQDKDRAMQMMGSLSNQALALEDRAYQYNVQDPFNLNYSRGIMLQNNALQGKIDAQNMRLSAFGDMMNGISDVGSMFLTSGLSGGQSSQKPGGLGQEQLRMRRELYGY